MCRNDYMSILCARMPDDRSAYTVSMLVVERAIQQRMMQKLVPVKFFLKKLMQIGHCQQFAPQCLSLQLAVLTSEIMEKRHSEMPCWAVSSKLGPKV